MFDDKTCERMPGKRTLKEYRMQGWNAAKLGHSIDECPYLRTSPADEQWRRGFGEA